MKEVNELITLGRISQVTFSGILAGNENKWNVAGIELNVTETQAGELPNLKDTFVQVTGEIEGKTVKVNAIQPHLVAFSGQIQQVNSGSIQVGGVKVTLDQNTNVNGELSLDQEVQITARQEDDGELIAVNIGGNQARTSTVTNEPAATSAESPSKNNNPKQPLPEPTIHPTQQDAPSSTNSGNQPMATVSPASEENDEPGIGPGEIRITITPTPAPASNQSDNPVQDGLRSTPTFDHENQTVTPTQQSIEQSNN